MKKTGVQMKMTPAIYNKPKVQKGNLSPGKHKRKRGPSNTNTLLVIYEIKGDKKIQTKKGMF